MKVTIHAAKTTLSQLMIERHAGRRGFHKDGVGDDAPKLRASVKGQVGIR